MNYAVDIGYGDGYGPDFVKIVEGFGGLGRRVLRPEEIKPALDWAIKESNRLKVPALVEIREDRETDAAMGVSIDNGIRSSTFRRMSRSRRPPAPARDRAVSPAAR
jgi:tartronate-semialdehyde synthase